MKIGLRAALIAVVATACFGIGAARAGDDGAAPLWEGIGSIFTPLVGLNTEEKPSIDYREHGKIVVPKSLELPQPQGPIAVGGGAWPVNQEVQRKIDAKAKEKGKIAGVGDAKQRYTHAFPNAPVTVKPSDQPDGAAQDVGAKAESPSLLGSLNPLGWVGMGKSSTGLGAEPDREWLTDPPKGYRAPVATAPVAPGATKLPPVATKPTGQASN